MLPHKHKAKEAALGEATKTAKKALLQHRDEDFLSAETAE